MSGVCKGGYWGNAAAAVHPTWYLAWAALGHSRAALTGVAPGAGQHFGYVTWMLFELFHELKCFPPCPLHSYRAL